MRGTVDPGAGCLDAACTEQGLDALHDAGRVEHHALVAPGEFTERGTVGAAVVDAAQATVTELPRQLVGIDLIALVAPFRFAPPVAHHDTVRHGLQDVVEPLGLGALLEGYGDGSPHASQEARQGGFVRGHDLARDHTPGGVPHRDDRRCLVHIQPHILRCAFHESRSLLGPFSGPLRPPLGTPKGRALKIRYAKPLERR